MSGSHDKEADKDVLTSAVNQINNRELKDVASRYGLILIQYVFGIKEPDNQKRKQFLRGLHQELNSIPDRERYDREIENFIDATLALLQNITSVDLVRLITRLKSNSQNQISTKRNSNKTTPKKIQTPPKKVNINKKKRYSRYKIKKPLLPLNSTSSYDPNYLSIQKKAKIALWKKVDAEKRVQSQPKEQKEINTADSINSKYRNRPLPSNGYVKEKLDPNQTKRAQDDRDDWKKIRKSRY